MKPWPRIPAGLYSPAKSRYLAKIPQEYRNWDGTKTVFSDHGYREVLLEGL